MHRLVLEILLILRHDLDDLVTKVICVVYLVGPLQFAAGIPRHMFRIFGRRLRIDYRAIMVLGLSIIRKMIFIRKIRLVISAQAIVLELMGHIFVLG